ncbi:hypothetical protein VNI00_000957 [Paramarasmius palmivorus]|uniref:Uncharacterized protein n=1 Tax=Paramarasmius palmivorus TaxID=297713 RepID=A0AAW0E6E9_9AGAR
MRVWRLSKENIPLTAIIAALVLAEFGDYSHFDMIAPVVTNMTPISIVSTACSVAFTIQSMKLDTWQDLTKLKGLSMTVNVLGAVADVFIATGLFFFLHRSRTGFKKSDTMISKLVIYVDLRTSDRGLTDETGGELSFSLQTFKSRHHKRDMTANSRSANISIKIDTTHEMVRDRNDRSGEINSSVTDKSFKDVEKKPMEEYSPSECHNDIA